MNLLQLQMKVFDISFKKILCMSNYCYCVIEFYRCSNTYIKEIKDKDITELLIPDFVEDLNDALNDCKKLKTLVLPKNLKRLGAAEAALSGCESLERIVLPPNLESIDDITFCGCKSLRDIYITGRKTSIGFGAFFLLESIINVHLLISDLEDIDIDENAFEEWQYEEYTLYVPNEIYIESLHHPVLGKFSTIWPEDDDLQPIDEAKKSVIIEEEEDLEEEQDEDNDYDDDEEEDFEQSDWEEEGIEDFFDFVSFFGDFEDDTIFKVFYTNKEYQSHHFRITEVKESVLYGPEYIDAFCIDKDGEYEGIERTFKIERFHSVKIDKKSKDW